MAMIQVKYPIDSLGQFNLRDSSVDSWTRSTEVNMQRQSKHLQRASLWRPSSCIISPDSLVSQSIGELQKSMQLCLAVIFSFFPEPQVYFVAPLL